MDRAHTTGASVVKTAMRTDLSTELSAFQANTVLDLTLISAIDFRRQWPNNLFSSVLGNFVVREDIIRGLEVVLKHCEKTASSCF